MTLNTLNGPSADFKMSQMSNRLLLQLGEVSVNTGGLKHWALLSTDDVNADPGMPDTLSRNSHRYQVVGHPFTGWTYKPQRPWEDTTLRHKQYLDLGVIDRNLVENACSNDPVPPTPTEAVKPSEMKYGTPKVKTCQDWTQNVLAQLVRDGHLRKEVVDQVVNQALALNPERPA